MTSYERGFMAKCAEYGVDPRIMIVNSPSITSSNSIPGSEGYQLPSYSLPSSYNYSNDAESTSSKKRSKLTKVLSILIPLLGATGAGYYGFKKYKNYKENNERIQRDNRIRNNLIMGGSIAAPILSSIALTNLIVNHKANKLVRPILNKAL
jgi:hypothetical protein